MKYPSAFGLPRLRCLRFYLRVLVRLSVFTFVNHSRCFSFGAPIGARSTICESQLLSVSGRHALVEELH
jgi:hypothetical protein